MLDLQTIDSHIARLLHRKRTLPELADIATLQREQESLADEVVAADTRVSDLERDQRRAEADLEPVRERRRRNQERIDSGAIADPKALNAMIEEVEHLGLRIIVLEDAELELMESLEQAVDHRAVLGRRTDALAEKLSTYARARDTKVADIDVEGRGLQRDRAAMTPGLPADLLALYDKLRASQGTGAAALQQRRCLGCQLEIDASALQRFTTAPADEVLRCDECSRILIRTPESGI